MKLAELTIQHRIQSPRTVNPTPAKGPENVAQNTASARPAFRDVLHQQIKDKQNLTFSAHAMKRLDQRHINLTPQNMERLQEGLQMVERKGSQSSLLFMDGTAFVLSVTNKTIITALSPEATREHVFTNIDSVAVV
ncbi:MAG: TIGR02530 family flagellar biosynthesis protein [Fidelibacterota bacterium]